MSKIFKTILLTAILATIGLSTVAQQAKQWTLKECVDYALENSLSVKRGLLNVQSSNIAYDQSKMALLPSLNSSIGTGFNWGRSIDITTNQFTTQRIQFSNMGVNSSVTLFNGFALRNAVKQNQLTFEASQNSLEKSKNDIIRNVILFYTNVIFAQELLQNAKYQLASSDEQLNRAKKQEAQGAIAKSALYDLMAQRATNEVNVVNEENKYNLAVLRLKQLLQIPSNEPFDIVHPQTELSETLIGEKSSVEQIYSVSEGVMPEIKDVDLRVQSADYALKAAKGRYYPTVTVNAGINTNYSDARDRRRFVPDGGKPKVVEANPQIGFVEGSGTVVRSIVPRMQQSGKFVDGYSFSDQFSDNIRQSASLSINIPIFNGFRTRAGVQRAMIQKKQAEYTAIETRNTLRQTIETAHNDVQAAAKSYNSSIKQVQAREEAYRTAQRRHELNAISDIDYQVAENSYFQAKSDLLRAKYDYIFKLKILDFYQGKPLDY